jgi:hypothetical protein
MRRFRHELGYGGKWNVQIESLQIGIRGDEGWARG